MPFEINNKKSKGRPKNSSNKITSEIRRHYQTLISDNLEQLKIDLKSLEPLARLKIIIELSKLVLPRPIDIQDENEQENVDLSALTTDDLRTIVKIFDKYENE